VSLRFICVRVHLHNQFYWIFPLYSSRSYRLGKVLSSFLEAGRKKARSTHTHIFANTQFQSHLCSSQPSSFLVQHLNISIYILTSREYERRKKEGKRWQEKVHLSPMTYPFFPLSLHKWTTIGHQFQANSFFSLGCFEP